MPSSSTPRQTVLLVSLTAAVAVLSAIGVRLGLSTWLEATGVVTGALCVALAVRESVWNFPATLVNVSAFGVLFLGARLFADAGLQVVYFGLALRGWYLWLHGGERHTALRVSNVPRRTAAIVAACGAALTLVLWITLRHVGGSASFFDALTTSISLCAQWMLNRKYIQNWYAWIAADLVYIPLYAYKELYLTSILYAVFLVMSVLGLREWGASWRAHGGQSVHPAPGPVPA